VVTRKLNWNSAGVNCRALYKDAHLLVINDAAEQSAVAGMLTSISSMYQFLSVMWSETFGHRTRLIRDQKLGLGLASLVLCCESRSCHARRHNDLEGHRVFKYYL